MNLCGKDVDQSRSSSAWLGEGECLLVRGGGLRGGTVKVQGSKNAAQKLIPIAAALPGVYKFTNLPDISDTYAVLKIIEYLGGRARQVNGTWNVDTRPLAVRDIPRVLTAKSTGTFQFVGALLGRFGCASVAPPGGDKIGARPVDLHIKSLEALGASSRKQGDLHIVQADRLNGTDYRFEIPSAGALINFLLAAVRSEGPTVVRNFPWDRDIAAACELLGVMGATIVKSPDGQTLSVEPIAEPTTEIEVSFEAPPDRNDTATWMIAGALSERGITLQDADIDDVQTLSTLFMDELGISVKRLNERTFRVTPPKETEGYALLVEAGPSPHLHSDWAQMLSVLLLARGGEATLLDLMYEARYGQVDGLRAMGAEIEIISREVEVGSLMYDRSATHAKALRIVGSNKLVAQAVAGGDVRGTMALTLAACIAEGVSTISGAEQLARGYENLPGRLKSLGVECWTDRQK